MEIRRQAFLLIVALLLGMALGLCYDFLRPIRRKCASVGRAVIDFVFALLSAAALFVFSMSAGSGRLGLWELCAALFGFLLYLYTLSDIIFPVFARLFNLFLTVSNKIGIFMKKQ